MRKSGCGVWLGTRGEISEGEGLADEREGGRKALGLDGKSVPGWGWWTGRDGSIADEGLRWTCAVR